MGYAYVCSLTAYLELGAEFPYDGGELIYVSWSPTSMYQDQD
jgi:hypothetical protein